MVTLLDNPVYNALISGDAKLSRGNGKVRFFDKEVSPFAAFETGYDKGFEDLHEQLPVGRKILFATRTKIAEPKGWKKLAEIDGLQFVLTSKKNIVTGSHPLIPLEAKHAEEMVKLAALTRPGPFDLRTIEFGNYYGIFENKKLVAMTGERLHVHEHTEVSAVCTHPDHTGKGYAAALLNHQLDLILAKNQKPFLHVRSDNERAIKLYERIGFIVIGPMIFYYLIKSPF